MTLLALIILSCIPLSWGQEHLNHFSVNAQDVSQSICPRTFLTNAQGLEENILEMVGEDQSITESVMGINFVKENSYLVDAFKKLFTRRGHYHPLKFLQPQINLVEDLQIRDCESVFCVVKNVWGESRGLKVLWIMLRYGFNTSEYAYDDSETPTEEELNDIITTLDLLPESAENKILWKNIPFLAFKAITGTLKEPPRSVVANSTVFFFDSLRVQNSERRVQAFHHELGHLVLSNSSFKDEWEVVSGWSWKEEKNDKCSVSRYGNVSSNEDFAETFNMYRFAPQRLEQKCPQKYEFMKKRIFLKEYKETHSCE